MDLQISKISVENVKVNGSEINEVQYNGVTVWKRGTPSYGTEYVSFSGSSEFTVSLNNPQYFQYPQYSLNKGTTWVNWNGNAVTVPAKGELRVRATGMSDAAYERGFIVSSLCYCGGDLKGLLAGSNEATAYAFFGLFKRQKIMSAPEITFTKMSERSCYQTFAYCTNLTNFYSLPATTLGTSCYVSMFYGCTSLSAIVELPATNLAPYCYSSMYEGCTNLRTPRSTYTLRATTLKEGCYARMFRNSTFVSSTYNTAIILPAKALVSESYKQMFEGCKYVSRVEIGATVWNSTYAENWLKNAKSSGNIFYLNTEPTNMPKNNVSGVPSGWTLTKR